MFSIVSTAASAVYIPGASLADKLRLAASKGQTYQAKQLILLGATFEPDRVSVISVVNWNISNEIFGGSWNIFKVF